MLQAALRYWCLVLLCSLMSSSAIYLPRLSTRVPSLQHIARVLESDGQHQSHNIVKRASFRSFAILSRRIARRGRYRTQRQVVEEMFNNFDMNRDRVIELDEFSAILTLLNLVRHRSRY